MQNITGIEQLKTQIEDIRQNCENLENARQQIKADLAV